MKELRYFIAIFALLLCPLASFACWDDDDDYLYDDSIWLDEVICTPDWDDDDDSDFDNGWWRSDDSDDNYDDENQDYGWDDDEPIGSSSDDWGEHTEKSNEVSLYLGNGEPLPKQLTPQNSKMNCVATVLEYIDSFLKSDMLSTNTDYRKEIESIYFEMTGLQLSLSGVEPEYLEDLLINAGFSFTTLENGNVYFCEFISDAIDRNDPVIGTVNTSAGPHEVLITSYYEDGNFGGYDPGTGKYVYIPNYSLSNVYEIYGR